MTHSESVSRVLGKRRADRTISCRSAPGVRWARIGKEGILRRQLAQPPMTSFLRGCAQLSNRPAVAEAALDACRNPRPSGQQKTAAFVLGADATEVADLLVPWQVLASSGQLELFTVGTSERLMPLTGKVFSVCDFVLGQEGREPPERCDVVVVPAVLPSEAALTSWVKRQCDEGSWILSVCEGARLVAAAGVLEGGVATTHFHSLDELAKKHKSTAFLHGHRYLVSRKVVSSAGVTAALDATLFLLQQVLSREVALATASALKYEWKEEDDPEGLETDRERSFSFTLKEEAKLVWKANGPFQGKMTVGVGIYPGVSEMALAAVLDCLPRTGSVKLKTFCMAAEVEPLDTRHGLTIVPKTTFEQVRSQLDLVIIPSVVSEDQGPLERILADFELSLSLEELPVRTLGGDSVGKAFMAALDASRDLLGEAPAALAAKMLECKWDP